MQMEHIGMKTVSVTEYRLAHSGDMTSIDITATIDGTLYGYRTASLELSILNMNLNSKVL